MRDEDLKNLPQSIERWRFSRMLTELGFGPKPENDLFEFWIDREQIHARVYATDADGRRYRQAQSRDDSMREPLVAAHEISIPFVGSWEKPAEDPQTVDTGMNDPDPDAPRCNAQKRPGDGTTPVCDRARGHAGYHVTGGITWPWEKPAPEVEPKYEQDAAGCPEVWPEEGSDWPCELPAGHGRLDLHAAHVGGVLKRW